MNLLYHYYIVQTIVFVFFGLFGDFLYDRDL